HRAGPGAQRARRDLPRAHHRPGRSCGRGRARRPRPRPRARGVSARARLRADRRDRRSLRLLRERVLRRRQRAPHEARALVRASPRASRRPRACAPDDGNAGRARSRLGTLARAGREPNTETIEEEMAEGASNGKLTIRPLTPTHVDEIGRATSELQSLAYLVCRLLLEKKKNKV